MKRAILIAAIEPAVGGVLVLGARGTGKSTAVRALASGENVVERDGPSVRHPARFVLVGSGNPGEGELWPQLLDRFAIPFLGGISADALIECRTHDACRGADSGATWQRARLSRGRGLSNLPIILIELVLIFGGVLAFGIWQLRSLRKSERPTQGTDEKRRP